MSNQEEAWFARDESKKRGKQGECWQCGESERRYTVEVDYDAPAYFAEEYECEACGARGAEVWSLVFCENVED